MDKFNNEGYLDLTAYHALEKIEKEERAARKAASFRPLVYICSPYSGDIESNTKKARIYSRFAVTKGYIPLHKFEEPSFGAMSKFAMSLPEIKQLAAKERLETAKTEFKDEDWINELEYDKRGNIVNTLRNIRLILENDEALKGIVFNQLADGMEITGDVPWQHPARFWRDADDAQLICYVDDHYGTFSQRNYDIAVTKVTDDRSYHPIKQYFDSLPPWDGIKRVDTLFIDYLGAEDNEYIKTPLR